MVGILLPFLGVVALHLAVGIAPSDGVALRREMSLELKVFCN